MTTAQDTGDFIVTIADVRKSGNCASGARAFFEDNGLDFRAFLHDGVKASTLLATGDARAVQVVNRTRERRYERTQ